MEESEQAELQRLRAENAELRNRLQNIDTKPAPLQSHEQQREAAFVSAHHLNASQIHRYSRQIILPAVSSLAQARICSSSALIIGCGGLGSPCAMYLAAAGVGRIGLVDHDQVELSNLHRQIMHTERGAATNQLKALSAQQTLQNLNSDITIEAHCVAFSSANACELIAQYDIVVDCTDNAVTRYIINDAAVLCGVPLISGAAIGLEGQLTIYNYRHTNSDTTVTLPSGPCYRCLFPTPPPPETVASCGNAGVLGVVPGVIGCLQALETLKVLGRFGEPLVQRLLLFDALACQFRTVKIRGQRASCVACSENATLTKENIRDFQYSEFCGNAPAHDKHVPDGATSDPLPSISCQQYQQMLQSNRPHILLDVRDGVQFDMCALPHALNIPLKQLPERLADLQARIDDLKLSLSAAEPNVVVVCRRGVNSKAAAKLLIERGVANVLNLSGGLNAWHSIDDVFPMY